MDTNVQWLISNQEVIQFKVNELKPILIPSQAGSEVLVQEV